jgi:hypothetical protein
MGGGEVQFLSGLKNYVILLGIKEANAQRYFVTLNV